MPSSTRPPVGLPTTARGMLPEATSTLKMTRPPPSFTTNGARSDSTWPSAGLAGSSRAGCLPGSAGWRALSAFNSRRRPPIVVFSVNTSLCRPCISRRSLANSFCISARSTADSISCFCMRASSDTMRVVSAMSCACSCGSTCARAGPGIAANSAAATRVARCRFVLRMNSPVIAKLSTIASNDRIQDPTDNVLRHGPVGGGAVTGEFY
jgi:hypothetical protein